jgi:hypothetical protein
VAGYLCHLEVAVDHIMAMEEGEGIEKLSDGTADDGDRQALLARCGNLLFDLRDEWGNPSRSRSEAAEGCDAGHLKRLAFLGFFVLGVTVVPW